MQSAYHIMTPVLIWQLAVLVIIVRLSTLWQEFRLRLSPHKDILYISGYGVYIILELIVYVCLGNIEYDNTIDTIS